MKASYWPKFHVSSWEPVEVGKSSPPVAPTTYTLLSFAGFKLNAASLADVPRYVLKINWLKL